MTLVRSTKLWLNRGCLKTFSTRHVKANGGRLGMKFCENRRRGSKRTPKLTSAINSRFIFFNHSFFGVSHNRLFSYDDTPFVCVFAFLIVIKLASRRLRSRSINRYLRIACRFGRTAGSGKTRWLGGRWNSFLNLIFLFHIQSQACRTFFAGGAT